MPLLLCRWKPSMVTSNSPKTGNNIAKPMFMRQIGADGSYSLVEAAGDMVFPRNVKY